MTRDDLLRPASLHPSWFPPPVKCACLLAYQIDPQQGSNNLLPFLLAHNPSRLGPQPRHTLSQPSQPDFIHDRMKT